MVSGLQWRCRMRLFTGHLSHEAGVVLERGSNGPHPLQTVFPPHLWSTVLLTTEHTDDRNQRCSGLPCHSILFCPETGCLAPEGPADCQALSGSFFFLVMFKTVLQEHFVHPIAAVGCP